MPGGRTAENCCRIGTYQTNTPHHAVAQLVALLETGFPSTPQHHHRLHRPGRRPFQGRSWKKKMTTGRAQQAIRRRRHHPRSHCPALNSAQRAVPASSTPTASRLPRHPYDIERRRVDGPPPPLPDLASQQVGVPRRTVASSPLLAPMATTERPKKPSRKVALALGYEYVPSPGPRAIHIVGVETLLRIPPSVLKMHNKKEDTWTATNGKVHNITPYHPYHPLAGGEKELMRVAGRDGMKLFCEDFRISFIVNVDFMLDACLVRFLVSESYVSSS
ncbi:hypothetical protein V8E55_003487 [Tylopilus felleus]